MQIYKKNFNRQANFQRLIVQNDYIYYLYNRQHSNHHIDKANTKDLRQKRYKGKEIQGRRSLRKKLYIFQNARHISRTMYRHFKDCTMLTLTLPSQQYSDKYICDEIFRRVHRWMFEKHSINIWIERREVQERGVIHAHIIFYGYIDKDEVNKYYYRLLVRHAPKVIDKYHQMIKKRHNVRNVYDVPQHMPPSAKIEGITYKEYIAKYINKGTGEQRRPLQGVKMWTQSDTLKNMKPVYVEKYKADNTPNPEYHRIQSYITNEELKAQNQYNDKHRKGKYKPPIVYTDAMVRYCNDDISQSFYLYKKVWENGRT